MTKQKKFVTYEEITTQTEAWREAIHVVDKKTSEIKNINLQAYQQVLFIGCGSTHYLAMAAASQFQSMTGVLSRAFPSSELLLFPESVFSNGKVLLIAISRSGTTSETLRVVKDFREKEQGEVIVVTNYSESPLSQMGDISISIDAGQEKSVAQTRSFASMYVAITALTYLLSSNKSLDAYLNTLINAGNVLIEKYQTWAKMFGEDHSINQIFYLGSGLRYGLANEVSLKLKEMSQTVTEAYHFFEFRHGPISMVDSNTLVVGLMSDSAFQYESMVLADVAKFGAKTIMVGEKDTDIIFNSGLPENVRSVLYLPVLQMLAYFRSVSFEKNPDGPRNITAVVELDLAD